jgi:endoglucanase
MNHVGKYFTALASSVATAALLSACGGGDAGAPFSPTPLAGFAVDGYLNGASVKCDASGVVVKTDSSGFFRFPDGCSSSVTLTGGTSMDTLLPFAGQLKAPAGATVITPLTTLLADGVTLTDLNNALGLPASTDLLNADPAYAPNGVLANEVLMKVTAAFQLALQKTTELLVGLAGSTTADDKQAIYDEVAAAAAAMVKGGSVTLVTGTGSSAALDQTVIASFVKAAALRVGQASAVSTVVKTAVNGVNADSLGLVVAGGLKAQTEAILKSGTALTAVTLAQQNNTAITTFIQTNKAALTVVPSNATAALGVQLTQALTGTPGTSNANNLVTNGDFSNGTTGWSGNAANVQTTGGNSYNFANVATAGNAFDVNLSYVLNIPTSGVAYKLRFKASSDRARTMVVGIGLNQAPYTNVTQVVNLTTTLQTFELSLTSNFASATSRVIFDMGADTGTVVIDDVELVLDTPPVATNLVTNGDFSNGTTGWSGNAANVQTTGGNSYNFANVATAGNAFDVNLSYVLNIPTSGVAYKLRFKASSDRARTMVAGIGLNQAPYTNVTQVVNLTTTLQTFELSLTSNFASATSRVIFDMGADTGNVVIDDVVLVLDTAVAPAPTGSPTVAASVPTASAANVKSIFSDSYTNVTVAQWGPDWGAPSARITDGVIAGNNYKTIDMSTAGQVFAGISFVSSKFDATAYTTFNMDYWIDTPIPVGQVLSIKLSNHAGSDVTLETSAIQTTVTNITGGSWQRLSIPLDSFTVAGGGSASRNNIAEIIITAARADTAVPVKVYFDNLYFSQ